MHMTTAFALHVMIVPLGTWKPTAPQALPFSTMTLVTIV